MRKGNHRLHVLKTKEQPAACSADRRPRCKETELAKAVKSGGYETARAKEKSTPFCWSCTDVVQNDPASGKRAASKTAVPCRCATWRKRIHAVAGRWGRKSPRSKATSSNPPAETSSSVDLRKIWPWPAHTHNSCRNGMPACSARRASRADSASTSAAAEPLFSAAPSEA